MQKEKATIVAGHTLTKKCVETPDPSTTSMNRFERTLFNITDMSFAYVNDRTEGRSNRNIIIIDNKQKEIKVPIRDMLPLVIDLLENTPGLYPELVNHLESPESKFSISEDPNSDFGYKGVIIYLQTSNSLIPIGCYLPDTNSFLVGYWTWHLHYAEVIVAAIWPKIIKGLKEIDYDISIKK